MTGQADCPQCGAMVVTHADRCPDCGYVPGMVDGWRPVLRETLRAGGPVKVRFEANDKIRIGRGDVDLELRDVVIWDFDGQRVEGPPLLVVKDGLGPEIAFPGRKAAQLWCDVRLLGPGPATLLVFERP
ncbi:MAG TPA: hypothetical protein VF950_30245 [Planctomycetota bacterium]